MYVAKLHVSLFIYLHIIRTKSNNILHTYFQVSMDNGCVRYAFEQTIWKKFDKKIDDFEKYIAGLCREYLTQDYSYI